MPEGAENDERVIEEIGGFLDGEPGGARSPGRRWR
jgi:hypothetical protein